MCVCLCWRQARASKAAAAEMADNGLVSSVLCAQQIGVCNQSVSSNSNSSSISLASGGRRRAREIGGKVMVEGEEKEGETIEAQAAVIRAHTLIHSLTHSLTAQAKLPASKSNRPGHPSHSCLLACTKAFGRLRGRQHDSFRTQLGRSQSVSQSGGWRRAKLVCVCAVHLLQLPGACSDCRADAVEELSLAQSD